MKALDQNNNKRALILGFPVDLITPEAALSFAENCIESNTSGHIVTLNPEMIMQSFKNPALEESVKNADLIIPDGIGIVLILKKLGINNIKQIPGIEFSYSLIEKSIEKGYKIGFLGASKEVIEAMTYEFKSKYPSINIVFAQDGYFTNEEEPEIIENIKSSGTQILFVALGIPKQELWIKKYKNIINSALMVGVGGSFDVWAKKVKRAPLLFRKSGLEWLFRLISQPSRFSRMFPTLPLFFLKAIIDTKNTRKES